MLARAIPARNSHRIRRKFKERGRQCERVASVTAQPSRHLIGPARGDGVETAAGYATKIALDLRTRYPRRGRLRISRGTNDAQIDGPHLNFSGFEGAPDSQRIADCA